MTSPAFSIGELSRRSGVTVHTIRFYESAAILQPARRTAQGHRQYHEADIAWLAFVLRLKVTGMPLADIRRYAELRTQGDATLHPRLAMLRLHRDRLARQMQELATCSGALDEKIGVYERMLADRPPGLPSREDAA